MKGGAGWYSASTAHWRYASSRKRRLTLVQAARLAGLSAEEFLALLGEAGIPAADYPAEELDEEVGTAS